MGFLNKFVKKDEGLDIDEFLNTFDAEADANAYDDADALVKSLVLSEAEDCKAVMTEVKAGNIVLLNIEGLSKRNAMKLKELIGAIKTGVYEINGDIAKISDEKVLITPSKVKIVKKKGAN